MGAGDTGGVTQGAGWPALSIHPSLPPSPRHCVDLFLDFVNIFRELLMILGMSEVGEGARAGQGDRGMEPTVTMATFPLAEQEEGEEVKRLWAEAEPPLCPHVPSRPSLSLKGLCFAAEEAARSFRTSWVFLSFSFFFFF